MLSYGMEKNMVICRYKVILVRDRLVPGGIYIVKYTPLPRLIGSDHKAYFVDPTNYELVDLNGKLINQNMNPRLVIWSPSRLSYTNFPCS